MHRQVSLMWLNKTVLHSYSLAAPQNWRSKERSFLMKVTHFIHRSTDRKTVVEWSLLLDLQDHNPKIRVRSRYHWIFWTNQCILGENLLPFCQWKLDQPSRTKKRIICLINQWKNGITDDVWCCQHLWLWLAGLHVKVCLIGLDI